MLDKNRIKAMVKVSFYEQGKGKEYLRISGYFKKDYVSFNTFLTGLWVTIGCFLILGVYVVIEIESILQELLSIESLIEMIREFVIIYLVILVVFCVISSIVHRQRHKNAKRHVKNYYRDLGHLEKIMTKENDKS